MALVLPLQGHTAHAVLNHSVYEVGVSYAPSPKSLPEVVFQICQKKVEYGGEKTYIITHMRPGREKSFWFLFPGFVVIVCFNGVFFKILCIQIKLRNFDSKRNFTDFF